jgi:hypothetical protein
MAEVTELDGMNSVMLDYLMENADQLGPAFAAFVGQNPTAMLAMVDAAKVARPWRIGKGLLGGPYMGAHRQALANNGVLLRLMQDRRGHWYAFGHADEREERISDLMRAQDHKLQEHGYGLADQPCEACTRSAPIGWNHPADKHNGKVVCFLEDELVFVHPGVCYFAWTEKRQKQREQEEAQERPARTIVGSTPRDNGEFRRLYDNAVAADPGRQHSPHLPTYERQAPADVADAYRYALAVERAAGRLVRPPLPANAGSFAEVAARAAVPLPPPLAQRMALIGADPAEGPDGAVLSVVMRNSNPEPHLVTTEMAFWPANVAPGSLSEMAFWPLSAEEVQPRPSPSQQVGIWLIDGEPEPEGEER